MRSILLWIVPPLAGALIGYVTNAVAIKMLFRPLKAVRIFGIRLPFTPGILPRQRHKLADSIGAMVERELLTAGILRERLRREDVRRAARNAVAQYRARLLDTPLGKLVLAWRAQDFLDGAVFSRLLYSLLGTTLSVIIKEIQSSDEGALGNRTLRELMRGGAADKLDVFLEDFIRGGLESSTPRFSEYLIPKMEEALPGITAGFIGFLKKPEIHRKLEIQGRIFLDNATLKLNSFQRFFITAGQYNRTLHDKMPEIIDDLIRQMEDLLASDDTRSQIGAFLGSTAAAFLGSERAAAGLVGISRTLVRSRLDAPLRELTRTWDEEELRRVILWNLENQENGGGRILGRALNRFLGEYGERPLGEFLALNAEQEERFDAFISEKLLAAADEAIPSILAAINVRVLVSDRIDALDMPQVERIVLDVMANQLKWINLFGGILGALIGVFQSVLSWFAR